MPPKYRMTSSAADATMSTDAIDGKANHSLAIVLAGKSFAAAWPLTHERAFFCVRA